MIRLQQFLHGYRDGHRLLSGSLDLAPEDARAMLVMSDSLMDSSSIGSGYITGYPLGNTGAYVVAHTWPALEVSRPGCVWTHSLLIDFADLASLQSLSTVIRYFKHPQQGGFEAYESSVEIIADREAQEIPEQLYGPAALMLERLYGTPDKPVVSFGLSAQELLYLVTCIWEQQWPRLRRTFRFCVGSSFDWPMLEYGFDLLASSGVPSVRRGTGEVSFLALTEQAGEISPWARIALYDLVHHDQSKSLRQFLRTYAADVPHGRAVFAPLAFVFALLHSTAEEPGKRADTIRSILERFALDSSQGVRLRELALRAILEEVDDVTDETVSYLVREAPLLSADALATWGEALAHRLWRGDSRLFWRFASVGKEHANALLTRVDDQDAASVDAVLSQMPLSIDVALEFPALISSPIFWRHVKDDHGTVLDKLKRSSHAETALNALIATEATEFGQAAVRSFGAKSVGNVFLRHLRLRAELRPTDWKWISLLIADAEFLSNLLAFTSVCSTSALDRLSRLTGPDNPISPSGDDPWLTALRRCSHSQRALTHSWLACFAVARAFGTATSAQAGLLSLGLDGTYIALKNSELPADAWDLLQPRLPAAASRWSWDQCKRVRRRIRTLCVEGRIRPDQFAAITVRKDHFSEFVGTLASIDEGLAYLKGVSRSLHDHKEPERAGWAAIVEKEVSRGWT